MPSSKLSKMIYKTDQLRKIERLIFHLEQVTPAQKQVKNELTYYIRNLKIILTCLLDSIHDFGAGSLIRGNAGYISYIINSYIIPEALKISNDPQNIRTYIINWINQWNSLTHPAVFINVPVHTQHGHTGSLYEFISTATGHDEAENFVALLLKVESVVLNRYNNGTLAPSATNTVHIGAIAVVNDYNARTTQVPQFLNSLYLANNNSKFFTIRDNGFGSYIFHNRDTNAQPPGQSLTDTIYIGPGRWDNGDNEQSVRNALNAKRPAMRLADLSLGHLTLTTSNILNNMITQNTRYDGGVLGFRYIRTDDDPNPNIATGVTFGNTIHIAGQTAPFQYETFIPFNTLRGLNKTAIKRVTSALIRNVTSISISDLKSELTHWFRCTAWLNGGPKKGEAVLKIALSQSAQHIKIKNANMIIGCLLDTKRSGDFMQSASVTALQTLLTSGGAQRKGIFATNDRIAGYISAKIHQNYTILSVKGSPLTMAAIWNAPNTTVRGNLRAPVRSAIRAEELNGTNRNVVPVGGGNKRQKYGSSTGRNMKKKNGGVFMPQKTFDANVDDFFRLMTDMDALYREWQVESNQTEIPSYGLAYKLAHNMYKLYGYINEHQELITNLFKKFFSTKITNFDTSKSIIEVDLDNPDHPNNPLYINPEGQEVLTENDMRDFIYGVQGFSETKDSLLEFMSLNAFKEFPNFIEELHIIHVDAQQKIILPETRRDLPEASRLRAFCAKITLIVKVYRPYILILKVIFEYQRATTINLITKINREYPEFLPREPEISEEITGDNLNTKTEALSLIIQFVSHMSEFINEQNESEWWKAWDEANRQQREMDPHAAFFVPNAVQQNIWTAVSNNTQQEATLVNFKNWVRRCGTLEIAFQNYEKITDILQIYYDNIYNLQELAKRLVDVSTTDRSDTFYSAVINGLQYYELSQGGIENFKANFDAYEEQQHAIQQQMEAQSQGPLRSPSPEPYNIYGTDDERFKSLLGREVREDSVLSSTSTQGRSRHGSVAPLFGGRTCRTSVPLDPFPDVSYGGSTKVVVYSDKIKKLTELNKKLRKNKIKNNNKIEKNNKQINELKEKIKKEKQKEREKIKKEKQKEKEKIKKEKQKETIKKQTKQQIKKETKQKEKQEKEREEKTKKNNTKTKNNNTKLRKTKFLN